MDTTEHLLIAHDIGKEYSDPRDTISDEARILTGCLHALIAIALIGYGGHPDGWKD